MELVWNSDRFVGGGKVSAAIDSCVVVLDENDGSFYQPRSLRTSQEECMLISDVI